MSKGIACRICVNIKDGECLRGNTYPVDRKDECWMFQNKKANSAIAEASEINADWGSN